ncbi:hypothetical protein K1719_019971 [Acacia pycnantha]|nr:hypothetical protein K1719_019971 [Acacia pycnantha]
MMKSLREEKSFQRNSYKQLRTLILQLLFSPKIMPLLHDPSHVRHQRRSFAKAFNRHRELGRDNEVMESWRNSLKKVTNLSGWDCRRRPEAELIEIVVEELWTKLRSRLPAYNSEELIGIDKKVKQLEPRLEMGLNDVRFVGIWGSSGVGKTTIARAVFDKYRSQFEIKCFLHNVRVTSERDGEVHLQSKLLSHLKIRSMEIEDTEEGKKIIQNRFRDKKVLLILDDVSHTSHLENLANSPHWFGSGSRVIITTTNSGLLRRAHKVYVYEVKSMDQDESLQLFWQKALQRNVVKEDLWKLCIISKSVCDYARGLPLALSVLGSFFGGRSSVPEWEEALDMLKKDPHKDIFGILQISFDALTDMEQTIFLDIACLLNGRRKEEIIQILESCGLNAKIGITMLHEKSLLKEYSSSLGMHDLLEQMGRKIVVDKSSNNVGDRSRLWSKEDIDEVMENKLGTKETQGVVSSTPCEARWHPQAFSTLHNLRLLMVSSSDFNLAHGLQCLSHALKVLHWTNYALDALPSRTRLHKLVDLKMHHSKLKKLWDESLCSKNLKFLDLSYSKNLIKTPIFSELPNLERLELEDCADLVYLHASIGQHKKHQVLNLKEFGESMKNVETLDAKETGLVKLPESLGLLTGLEALKLRGCKNLVAVPQTILNLKRLRDIDISCCSKFAGLPEKFNELEALEELDSSETDITEVPYSLGGLKKVKKLSLGGCKRSTSRSWSLMFWRHSIHKGLTLPASILRMTSLRELDLSHRNIDERSIPNDFSGLSSLLRSLPQAPPSLRLMDAGECASLETVTDEQLLHLFASIDQAEKLRGNETFSMTIPGSEIPSWFENQIDLCLDDKGEACVMIDIPPCEEMLGIGLCIVLDDKFYSTDPSKKKLISPKWWFDFAAKDLVYELMTSNNPLLTLQGSPVLVAPLKEHAYEKEIQSSHVWMLFWKQREELSQKLQLSKYSQIPLTFDGCTGKLDAKVSIKFGWCVICRGDFENSSSSMSQNLLPSLELHKYQGVRTPMLQQFISNQIFTFRPLLDPHPESGRPLFTFAASVKAGNQAACGGLIRNNRGQWVMDLKKSLELYLVTMAEILAIKTGLQVCKCMNLREIQVLSDSLEAINTLLRDSGDNHPYRILIEKTRQLLYAERSVEIRHAAREILVCTDKLAREAHSEDPQVIFLS